MWCHVLRVVSALPRKLCVLEKLQITPVGTWKDDWFKRVHVLSIGTPEGVH